MASLKSRAKLVDEILNEIEPKIGRAYQEGVRNIQDRVVLQRLADLIAGGDITQALAIIDQVVVAEAFITFNRELQAAMQAGGDLAERFAMDDSKFRFSMNIAEATTARFLVDYQATKIRDITNDMRELMSVMIRSAVTAGENPKVTARRIREGLGLTARQEQAVRNYRRLLETLDSDALQRRLRDGRFDRTVARAIREGQPLTKAKIDQMVEAYRRRSVALRARTIARTESIRMLSAGQNAFWEQAVGSGKVVESQLKRFWIPTLDSKLREAHAAIPRMNKEGVGMREAFKSPLGLIRFPGDPSASAANTINCRCAVFTRIVE